MKKFCTSLREHTTYITDFGKKQNDTINKKELKLHIDTNICCICRNYDTNAR